MSLYCGYLSIESRSTLETIFDFSISKQKRCHICAMAALEVVKMTASGAVGDKFFFIKMTFPFQLLVQTMLFLHRFLLPFGDEVGARRGHLDALKQDIAAC